MSRDPGYGEPQNFQARYQFAFWSLQAKHPQLSTVSLAAWVGLRYGDEPGPDNRTTAERLADRRYNPFMELGDIAEGILMRYGVAAETTQEAL